MFLRALARAPPRRSFVSSVLLTRTWENESVAQLRKEAQQRGLPARGTKATLILRLQAHETESTLAAAAPHPVAPKAAPARRASTTATPPPAAHEEGVAPGIPPAAESHAVPPSMLLFGVNIPDLSHPPPETPIQIPYVPDFWDSSAFDRQPEAEEVKPVMLVVGGEGTHLLSPSHNLFHFEEQQGVLQQSASQPTSWAQKSTPPGQGGLWDDIAEDIGLPPPKVVYQAFWKLFS